MKPMKTDLTVPYNLKKLLTGIMLVAIPAFTSCEKEPVQPNQPSQPQTHNVELKYGKSPSTQWQNISIDTLNKYNSDPTVDTIFIIPEQANQYSTLSTNGCKIIIDHLRERKKVNPNKVFGKGDIELKAESVQNNPEISRFFADTLGHHVITR